jgi:biopolymer transport protein ExbB
MSLCFARSRAFVCAAVLAAAVCCAGPGCGALGAEAAPSPDKAAPAAAPAPDKAAAAPASPPTAEKRREELQKAAKPESLGRFLLDKTGWLGWAIYAVEIALSLVATTVVLERAVNLRRRKLIPRRFVRRLRDLIARREDSAENLRTLCENSESPIANVLMRGVSRAGRPLPEIEKAMEDAVIREAGGQRSRNRILGVIGTVAPMVGLLGTVLGMIMALRDTSQAGAEKAQKLAEGIYLALGGTAGGLLVAVPALLLVHWYNTRVDRYAREMVDVLQETIPTFAAMDRGSESNGEVVRASEPIARVKTR